MSTRILYALLTKQGTAMAETACCDHCGDEDTTSNLLAVAEDAGDWDGGIFSDCTDNDALTCVVCGWAERV